MRSYDGNYFLILTTAAQTINFALFELALQIKFYVTDSVPPMWSVANTTVSNFLHFVDKISKYSI
jgi:hypothetical protein